MRRLLYLLPVLLFLVLAGYFAWSLRPGHDPRLLPSALLDRQAPDFVLPVLAGAGTLRRDDLLGQPVLINIFASWCAPCRIEHPLLMRLARQPGVYLVGIAYKDRPEDSRRFLAELGDPYRRVGVDQDGRTGVDFGVYGVPETYVLDRRGHVRHRHVGPLSPAVVDRDLVPLLRQLAAP
jgi:cytochrome c biogenesis protein CcmG/thiol:disulfide interchange protein DsbE